MMDKKYVLIKVTKDEVIVTPVKREDYPQMLVFNEACARHPSGTTVVLDGNHRILAALSSGSFPDVTMLVLEGKEFSKMSNKHPDLKVLK